MLLLHQAPLLSPSLPRRHTAHLPAAVNTSKCHLKINSTTTLQNHYGSLSPLHSGWDPSEPALGLSPHGKAAQLGHKPQAHHQPRRDEPSRCRTAEDLTLLPAASCLRSCSGIAVGTAGTRPLELALAGCDLSLQPATARGGMFKITQQCKSLVTGCSGSALAPPPLQQG